MPPASRGPLVQILARAFSSRPRSYLAQPKLPTKPKSSNTLLPNNVSTPKDHPSQIRPNASSSTQPILLNSKPNIDTRIEDLRQRITGSVPPSYRHILRWIGRFLLIAPPVAVVTLHFPFDIMSVNGQSMSPYLNPNYSSESPNSSSDKILVQKVFFPERGAVGLKTPKLELQRGQIVVFYTPHAPDKIAVKRVVGVPGDRVTPLPGYPGGDEPVVVQYNHVWVEGDVNNRDKSIDSNWYGPISQNLVIGVVRSVIPSWFNWVSVRWEHHKYPAKESLRVEENVVQSATVDPHALAMEQSFQNGKAESMLALLKSNPDSILSTLGSRPNREALQGLYNSAVVELERQDPQTADVAAELVQELDKMYLTMVRMRGPQNNTFRRPKSGAGEDRLAEETPAQKALKEYMDQKQAAKEKELAELNERSKGWLKDAFIAPSVGLGLGNTPKKVEAVEAT